ncbi:MAG: acyl transferase domain-containing protein/NADPH:quinone reductase-like Zn-dependent oxidoreductase, partial [Bacteroidia bacterium]
TSLGDPIEVAALDAVFRTDSRGRKLNVGTIKTQIGHSEPAAGIAGLIRVVLSLGKQALMPNLHFNTPNPHIDWAGTVVSVVDERRSWESGDSKRRFAGVNSFGFSGTNAHAVLEEAPAVLVETPEPKRAGDAEARTVELIPISAKSPAALARLCAKYEQFLLQPGNDFRALAATAATGRDAYSFRATVLASNQGEAAAGLGRAAKSVDAPRIPPAAPRIAFLFTGQGSQYVGMGAELYASFPAYRAAFDQAAVAVANHGDLDLHQLIFHGDAAELDNTAVTQPALFAVGYALVQLWRAFGVEPTWVLGHSVGEFAAACAAGVMDLDDCAKLIVARGRLMMERTPPGAMLAVLASPAEVEEICAGISPDIAIAANNCDARISISGSEADIQTLSAKLETAGIRHEHLRVSRAFHSPLMEPMLEAFGEVARTVSFRAPHTTFVSTLDASLHSNAPSSLTDAAYWVDHVRSPVRFLEAMKLLDEQRPDVLLEIGPAPHLLGLSRRFLEREELQFLPSLRPGTDGRRRLLETAAALFEAGCSLDFRADHAPGPRATIPAYSFEPQAFWLAPRPALGASSSDGARGLLGAPVDSSRLGPNESVFLAKIPFREDDPLRDHSVLGQPIFPGAGYVSLAVEAARSVGHTTAVHIKSLDIAAALALGSEGVRIETVVFAADELSIDFFGSQGTEGNPWEKYASAVCEGGDFAAMPTATWEELELACPEIVDPAEQYERAGRVGLTYGPAYRTVHGARVGEGQCLVQVQATSQTIGTPEQVDPAVLDGCLQAAVFVVPTKLEGTPFLPLTFEGFTVHGPVTGKVRCHLWRVDLSGRVMTVAFQIWSDSGELLATCSGLKLLATDRATLQAIGDPLAGLAFHRQWIPRPAMALDGVSTVERTAWVITDIANPESEAAGTQALAALAAAGFEVHGLALDLTADSSSWAPPRDDLLVSATPTDIIDMTWLHAGTALGQPARLPGLVTHLLDSLAGLREARPRYWAVTSGAEFEGRDLAGAAIWGVSRCLALEEPRSKFTCLDLDPLAPDFEALSGEVAGAGDEREVAWRDGRRLVARLTSGAEGSSAASGRFRAPDSGSWRIAIKQYGSLDHLGVVPVADELMGPRDVRIAVESVALNFKDVLFALGMLKDFTGITRATEQPLGLECAGRIVAMGDEAGTDGRLALGTRVFAAGAGSMRSSLVLPADQVMVTPDELTSPAAAGLPTVYLTTLYALDRVAKLRAGDRVLIHAAAGGVGQAAIQLAKSVGAEVFATASRGKWAHLRSQGIEHIFDSRSFDYTQQVLDATGGAGVDVVLDSMAGEHVMASLDCLSHGGRFVEIGKIDTLRPEEMQAKRGDVQYALFDMADVLAADEELYKSLREDLVDGFASGRFSPPEVRVFGLDEAGVAFRHLAAARNIGKVAISFPRPMDGVVRESAAYLVTGGLGSLGLHVAGWLGQGGAGEVVLAGRSGLSPRTSELVDRLAQEFPGTTFRAAAVDVSDAVAVAGLLQSCSLPIEGVVHAAGVIDDGMVSDLNWERFHAVLKSKWDGAWNLHQATRSMDLSFFVLFSSMTAMVGAAGQSNYAAANAGLDALARYRRSEGLPATSIAWGPWSGGGMATRAASAEALDAAGIGSISPELGIAAMHRLLGLPGRYHTVGILAVDWKRYLSRREALPLFAMLTAGEASATASTAAVIDLSKVEPGDLPAALTDVVAHELAAVLGYASPGDVNLALGFPDLGVDSLLAVDMRNRLEHALGVELPVTILFDFDNPSALATGLVELVRVGKSTAVDQAAGEPSSAVHGVGAEAELLAEIESLSEEEVARLLAAEDALEDDVLG